MPKGLLAHGWTPQGARPPIVGDEAVILNASLRAHERKDVSKRAVAIEVARRGGEKLGAQEKGEDMLWACRRGDAGWAGSRSALSHHTYVSKMVVELDDGCGICASATGWTLCRWREGRRRC